MSLSKSFPLPLPGLFHLESPLHPETRAPIKSGLWSLRQYSQLIIQLLAFSQLQTGALSEHVKEMLSHFETGKITANKQAEQMSSLMMQLIGMVRDPLLYLSNVLRNRFRPAALPVDFITNSYKSLILKQISKDSREADAVQSERKVNSQSSLRRKFLKYLPLQENVRNKVLNSIPLAEIQRGRFRSKRIVEMDQTRRRKHNIRARVLTDKNDRRRRKQMSKVIDATVKDFNKFHLNVRKLAKTLALEAVRFRLTYFCPQDDAESSKTARLKALKDRNEDEYIRLVQDAKNERLLFLLKMTDEFMSQLGAAITREQRESEERKVFDGLSRSISTERIQPSKQYYALVHKTNEVLAVQPELAGGNMREYQLAGLNWLVSLYNNNLNGILADEMGLGKTVQTISLLAHLMQMKNNQGPFLIISPMSLLRNNWEFEFTRWLPSCVKIVYDGDKMQRKELRDEMNSTKFQVLLTTFEFAMRDKRFLKRYSWEYIIVDEAHRLKNPKCRLVQDLNGEYNARRRLALTGTPLQNDIQELWALLNFLHPHIFNAAENFQKWFSAPFANMPGTSAEIEANEEEKLLVVDRLHSILRPFLLRRIKSEVETQLPEKVEKVLHCQMTPLQSLLYSKISSKELGLHNIMVQLRKVANHPLLFHPWNHGNTKNQADRQYDCNYATLIQSCGKMELLDRILSKLSAASHRVLLFCQMTKMMDILEDYCAFRGYIYRRLDGGTPQEDRTKYLTEFNAKDSKIFLFMLSTKAGGLGLNLQSANTVILYDSDWNPQADLQAQARAHRIGQLQQVVVLRLVTANTVEESILNVAKGKLEAEAMVISAGMFNERFEEEQSHKMLEKVIKKKNVYEEDTDEEAETKDDVSQAIARNESELVLFEQLDRDRKINLPKSTNEIPSWASNLISSAAKRIAGANDISDLDASILKEFAADDIGDDELERALAKRRNKIVSYKEANESDTFSDQEETDVEVRQNKKQKTGKDRVTFNI